MKYIAICLVCGKEDKLDCWVPTSTVLPYMCNDCRKAVLTVRKMIEKNKDGEKDYE